MNSRESSALLISRVWALSVVMTSAVLASCTWKDKGEVREALIEVVPLDSVPIPTTIVEPGVPVAFLGESTIVLVDEGEQAVVCLNMFSGQISCRIGRRGSGPGEFQGISYLHADDAGRLGIADALLRRVTVVAPDKSIQRTVPTPGVPGRIFAITDEVVWLDWIGGMSPEIGALRPDGSAEWSMRVYEVDSSLAIRDPMTLQPSPFLALAMRPDGSLLAADPMRYRIDVIARDKRSRQWAGRADLKPTFLSPADVDFILKQTEARIANLPPGSRPSLERMRESIVGRPKPFFSARGMIADRDGRVWLLTTRGIGDSTVVDIIGKDGEYRQSITFPERIASLAVQGDRVAYLVHSQGEADGGSFVRILSVSGP